MSSIAFLPARAKLCIASLDDHTLQVCAMYNPKELQLEKQIDWQDHKSRNNQSEDKRSNPRQDSSEQSDLEFKAGAPRSMMIELLFDRYEIGESVEPDIMLLETLSSVQKSDAQVPQQLKQRPHHCVITWGASRGGMRPFRCVIESLSVTYTMWNHGGMPVRATCKVKVKEAQKMVGSRETPTEYGEQWREPLWERRSPLPERNPEAERYMQELANKRDRMGK